MSSVGGPNPVASIRQRLRNLAAARSEEFGLVLTRYANQRLLFRLSQSEHRHLFLLKGATLFAAWSDAPHRPTRDLDLLGVGDNEVAVVANVFREVCAAAVEPDGLVFVPETIQAARIRDDQEYEGVRVTFTAMLGKARIPMQVDVGFGDAVFPEPVEVSVAGLIGFPDARLRAYPREAVVAEKFQAMVALGMANSRMKDFYDLWVLSRDFAFAGEALRKAIAATFARRRTSLPETVPLALSPAFANAPAKTVQWRAFVRKAGLTGQPELGSIVDALLEFLWPPVDAAGRAGSFTRRWQPSGPWRAGPDGR